MERHRSSPRLARRLAAAVAGAALFASVAVPAATASDTLWVDASLTLTADRDGGIVIGADGITLDCAGHTLFGDGTGPGIFLSDRTGVTIRNCVVTGFFRGIELHASSHNLLVGNTATNSVGGSGFFIADGSNSNVLQQNTANDNGAPGADVDGFRVQESDDNVLRDNAAARNPTWGFIVTAGSGNRLLDNRSSGNEVFGFVLDSATSTVLVGNAGRHNGGAGFGVGTSQSSTLRGNVAADNGGHGIVVYESTDTVLAGNVAERNSFDGISVGFSSRTTATGNRLEDNGEFGFYAFDSDLLAASRNVVRTSLYQGFQIERVPGVQLTANTVEANHGDGFAIVDSSAVNVSGNVTRSNDGSGFAIFGGADGRYVGNTMDRNGGDGLFAIGGQSMLVSGNSFTGNGETGNGIVFYGSAEVRVENNTASGAAGQCFGFYDGTHASVMTRNQASACSSAGFDIGNATDNTLVGNTATGNVTGPGFSLGPNAEGNVLASNIAIGNHSGFQLWSSEQGVPSYNRLTGNTANANDHDGFVVQEGAAYNTFVRNRAHGNGDWDAIQHPDAGPGNVWSANNFGVTAGF